MNNRILNRETRYTGHAFNVSKVSVKLPDGRQRAYDLVEHADSVTIVPVTEDGQIYFVSQYRIGADNQVLELPAGVLDENEDPITAAHRELQEETGKAASKLQELGGFYLAPGYSNEYMRVFLAKDLANAPLEPDEDEFLEVTLLPISEVYQKVISGEIYDAKTLAALLLAKPFLL